MLISFGGISMGAPISSPWNIRSVLLDGSHARVLRFLLVSVKTMVDLQLKNINRLEKKGMTTCYELIKMSTL
jgi:hypothetical protein